MGTGLFGQAGGAESQTLTAGQIPAITSRNAAQAINVVTSQKVVNGPNQGSAAAGGTQVTASLGLWWPTQPSSLVGQQRH
jgi:hypothetical protein